MSRKSSRRGLPLAALFVAFFAGMFVDWALHHYGPPKPAVPESAAVVEPTARVALPLPAPSAPTAPSAAPISVPVPTTGSISAPPLRMPIDHMDVETMKGGFHERRGSRPHEAADLLAPRNTPVHAVESGTIAKLFVSKAGGLTIYQFDPSGQVCYYYAHLERYADGLREGRGVSAGEVIGYVGTSGNAPPNTPHLHFAVFELNGDREWWKGRAVDPYPLFKNRAKG
jgi:murein DD-endopeptidase MepM/ murein hydrolase activator NlpD